MIDIYCVKIVNELRGLVFFEKIIDLGVLID